MKKIILFICLLPLVTVADELPDIGDSSYHVLSPFEEKKLGQVFYKAVRSSKKIISDPLISDYMQRLGGRLVDAASQDKKDFHFFFIRDQRINAFAGPAGYIGIHSGLLLITRNESELAAAVAHEIAHVTQRHIAHSFEQAEKQRWISLASLIAAVAIGTQNSTLGTGAVTASLAGMSQQFVNFTRQNEMDADRVGIKTLSKAGFNPKSMAEFFEHMQQAKRIYTGFTPEILSTHPVSSTRIADALNRAINFPKGQKSIDPLYPFILERSRVITYQDNETLLAYYAGQKKKSQAKEYGHALALLKAHRIDKARDGIEKLMAKDASNIVYPLALAEIELEVNNMKRAEKILSELLKINDKSYPVLAHYGDALLRAGEYEKARLFLLKQTRHFPKNADFFWLLGKAQGEVGQIAQAYESRAKALVLINEQERAVEQLKIALRLPDNDKHTVARIEARLVEWGN